MDRASIEWRANVRDRLRPLLPRSALALLRFVKQRDYLAFLKFAADTHLGVGLRTRLRILQRFYMISRSVDSGHVQAEVLSFTSAVLRLPPTVRGAIVEAGCYKGSGTAKFSIVAKLTGRELVAFDSFEGIPANDEAHQLSIYGNTVGFPQGDYAGSLEEVRGAVARFGELDSVRFVRGWFDDTLPSVDFDVAAAYLDVDLVSSTRTCLKYLYPRLGAGGMLFSQDGHLPLVIELLGDGEFWANEVGVDKPHIDGLGAHKLVVIRKS